jgi:HEPN domain-containing protein
MKTPENEAIRWMGQSENDLKFVQWLLQEDVYFDKGCFIAQQSGEKAAKACLYAAGKRHVIGPSIYELAAELSEKDSRFAELMEAAKQLDRHYIPTRYPNGLPGGSPFSGVRP